MRGGIHQRQRLGLLGDQADKALALAHGGLVHGLAVEALGGVKLKRAVRAQHIDRAYLRDHIGRDQDHDSIEPLLRADRLRHDLPEPAQQDARTAERLPHVFLCVPPMTRMSWQLIYQPIPDAALDRAASTVTSVSTRRPALHGACRNQRGEQ